MQSLLEYSPAFPQQNVVTYDNISTKTAESVNVDQQQAQQTPPQQASTQTATPPIQMPAVVNPPQSFVPYAPPMASPLQFIPFQFPQQAFYGQPPMYFTPQMPLTPLNPLATNPNVPAACPPALDSNKSKTLCRFFARGYCQYGDSCNYVHNVAQQSEGGVSNMNQPDTLRKVATPCKFFARGYCRFNDQCRYLHETPEMNAGESNNTPNPSDMSQSRIGR